MISGFEYKQRQGMLSSITLFMLTMSLQGPQSSYQKTIQGWRQNREAELKADDGWLTLAGLFWLKEGENSFGADLSNNIVLPAGSAPAAAGVFEFHQGKVMLRVVSEAKITLNGQPITSLNMRSDGDGAPDVVAIGQLTMQVIRRGDRYGIRLKDKDSRLRKQFTGLRWFPVREPYCVTARFVPHDPPKTMPITNILGDTDKVPSPGYVVFTLNKKQYQLDALTSGPDQLFFIFRDLTSGRSTYAAARFLYSEMPKHGKVVLDFNKAQNPPCVFTSFATCPLPPRQNRLPVVIEAGEMNYQGPHNSASH